MIPWILLLGLANQAPLEPTQIQEYATASIEQLRTQQTQGTSTQQALARLFLTASDTTEKKALPLAYPVLDSLYQANPTALHAVLLGTAEALYARQTRHDVFAATRWVGKSLAHLDAAVATDSVSLLIRTFRIRSLVEVPEIFHVNERLRADERILRHHFPRLANADPSTKLTLASLDYRFGKLTEAIALWKNVATSPNASLQEKREARSRLQALHD